MKTVILTLLVFAISYMGVHSQNGMHPSGSNERVISSTKIEYLNMEEGWVRKKNSWYYHGNQIMVTPVSYSWVETIDSTYMSNEEESKIRIEIREESSGKYKTSEEGWSWNDGIWIFEKEPVPSYPPSFTREAKIKRTRVEDEVQKMTRTDEIEEFYQLEDEKWTWDLDKRVWLYDNIDSIRLPEYKITRSRVVTQTGNPSQLYSDK